MDFDVTDQYGSQILLSSKSRKKIRMGLAVELGMSLNLTSHSVRNVVQFDISFS